MALKPDPEGQNDARADWAAAAVETFVRVTRTDPGDAVSDLLADLMHYCDRNATEFEHELARGRRHYEEETSEDGFPHPDEPVRSDGPPIKTVYLLRQASTGNAVAIFKNESKATKLALQMGNLVEPWTFYDEGE